MRDPKAMQAAASKDKTRAVASDVVSRYMAMGSWHADLSDEGKYFMRSPGKGKLSGRAKKKLLKPPPGGWKGGAG